LGFVLAVSLGCGSATDDNATKLVQEFARLKNAGDPAADLLLAPAPQVPEMPISQEEAGRLDAEFILRDRYQVAEVRPLKAASPTPASRFVLVLKGSVASQRLQVQTPTGVDRVQRTMHNPDVIVEVRDGAIHGVRAKLHED
jgi:hypothetical protein